MKKIHYKFSNTLFFLFISILMICCKKQNDEKIDTYKTVIESTLNKELVIPSVLHIYAPFKNYSLDSAQIAQSKMKIYTPINISCGSCVEDIDGWIDFYSTLEKYNIPIILICSSNDNFELLKYQCENNKMKQFPYPFFLDMENEYISKNYSFMKESNEFETVLTDCNNKILLLGNPIHSEDTKQLYLKEIAKRME